MSKQILFTEDELKSSINKISKEVNKVIASQKSIPVFICVLNGAFMFFSELVKKQGECVIDFIRVKSYNNKDQAEIQLIKNIEVNITGRDVFLIDDIFDSGNTMRFLIETLKDFNPNSITPVTLFKKQYSKLLTNLIYGLELKNEYWILGFGLDSENGTQRNLPFIWGELIED